MSNILFTNIVVDVIIGIDLGSFHVVKDQPFKGIVNIPHVNDTDLHVIHFQHVVKNQDQNETNEDSGLRYGYWITHGSYYVVYNEGQELYEIFQEDDSVKYELAMKDYIERNMVSEYPKIDEGNRWGILSNKINWPLVKTIVFPKYRHGKEERFVFVDSSMTTWEENELLRRTLIKDGHYNSDNDGDNDGDNDKNRLFHYSPIKFKSKEAMRDDYKMEDFQDKSYYFNEIIIKQKFKGKEFNYIGELQYSYLNLILFGNYGSSLQWHSMIELVCRSSQVSKEFIGNLDNILSVELDLIPIEYRDVLINEKLWISLFTNDSFQKENLPKTHSMLIKCHIIEQDSSETQTLPQQDEESEEEEVISFNDGDEIGTVDYHRLDSSEDEDGPTIVGGIYYG